MEKVAIIGTVGLPAKYGGFETLAAQLVNHLKLQCKLTVYCSSKSYKKGERPSHFKGARLFYIPLKANGVQSVLYDMLSMIHALFYADTFLILGVSGGLLIPFLRLFTRKTIIVNIDGLEWRRAKWSPFAKAFLRYSEKVAVKWSHADITDNASIKRYTSRHYGTLSHLIEYGGDQVIPKGPTAEDHKKYDFLLRPYAFKVARIEPENNIEMVLKAFVKANKLLVLVGNWNSSEYGLRLLKQYEGRQNLHLLQPIYDQEELDLLRTNCLLYVHGHSAGGTNPSLVEAMCLDLPIMAFDCSFNRETTEREAIYFKNSDALVKCLNTTSFPELIAMRSKMRDIAQRRYTWNIIATKYLRLIRSARQLKTKQSINSHYSELNDSELNNLGLAHLKAPLYYYEKH